jgi:hypothetical protein
LTRFLPGNCSPSDGYSFCLLICSSLEALRKAEEHADALEAKLKSSEAAREKGRK